MVNSLDCNISFCSEFPAGILQNIFLNKVRPNFMKYGDFGYAIGHEITHGFDDTGKQFDKNGNLIDWWTPSTEEQFLQRKQCIIEQYGNYIVPELGLHVSFSYCHALRNIFYCVFKKFAAIPCR